MAEFNFFNYAKSVGDAEAIIGARTKNAINTYKLEDAQNTFKKRKEREAIMQQHADTPSRIQALSDAGQVEGAMELQKSYLEIEKGSLALMEQKALGINADTWDDFRYQEIKNGADPAFLPADYDPGWMNSQIKQKQSDLKNVTTMLGPVGPEGQVMAQDTLRAGGKETTGEPYDYAKTKRASTATGADRYKAADANAIRSAVRANFGSLVDPTTGQFRILDKTTEAKIAGVQAEAERLYDSGRFPTHLAAVEEALKGFEEPVATKPRNRDPAGIR